MSDDHLDLVGLLEGDLDQAAEASAEDHLHSCPGCTTALLEMAVALGRLRDARRYQPAEPSDVPPLRLDRTAALAPSAVTTPPTATQPRSRDLSRRSRVSLVAAGLVVALFCGLAGGIVIGDRNSSPATPAGVTLTAIGLRTSARGQAHMLGAGEAQRMQVEVTGLASVPADEHYEVWLLDTATGRALPVGPVTGSVSTYPLPASKVAGFDAIDVSVQTPADGSAHSGNSVLRGTIA